MSRVSVDGLRRDERGWALSPGRLLRGGMDEVAELHVVSLRPGAVRGNHRHPDGTEWLLVVGGRAAVAWRDPAGVEHRDDVSGSEPALYRFAPGVDHAVRCEDDREIFVVAGSDVPRPTTRDAEPLL